MLHLPRPALGSSLIGAVLLSLISPSTPIGAEVPPPPPPTLPSLPETSVLAVPYSQPSPLPAPTWSLPPLPTNVPVNAIPVISVPASYTVSQTTSPYTAISPTFSRSGYLIYVPGSSDRDLRSVQAIEPTALIRQWRGQSVIQAGFFQDAKLASARLQALAARGLTNARSEAVSPGTSITGPNTGVGGSIGADRTKGYYVVIPGNAPDLYPIRQSLQRIVRPELIFSSILGRRGPYVGVGPFSNRAAAAQVENRLIKGQFDNARVYFGSF